MNPTSNPSAFPLNTENTGNPGAFDPEPGMSLRDWFAGQALNGDLASQSAETGQWDNFPLPEAIAARVAVYYRFADAMLAERAKGGAA